MARVSSYFPCEKVFPVGEPGRCSLPVHRSIVAVDMERSTTRTNPVKEELRSKVYLVFEEALRVAGIKEQHLDPFTDRGDGVLALVHPADEVPKTLLLNPLVPVLAELLAEHNAGLSEAEQSQRELRLRMVVHAGEVHYDGKGYFGEALDVAFRLLDAPQVKRSLRRTGMPMVLVVSGEIFWSIVRHDYDGIDEDTFEPAVRVNVAGRRHRGWVHVPAATESVVRAS